MAAKGADRGTREDSVTSLLDSIGGKEAVKVVVDRFYQAVWDDAILAEYFVDSDRERLKAHQTAFVSAALDEAPYLGRSMRAAHAGAGIDSESYDRMVGHLAHAMADSAIPTPVIESVVRRLSPLRSEILQDAEPAAYAEALA